MATLSQSEKLLKTMCGSCLIAAPAVLLVGGSIHPEETTDAARQYEILVDQVDRWELAHWLISAAMLLMMGAVVGLAHLLRRDRPVEGIVGGAATMVGTMALFAVATAEATVITELGRADPAAASPIFERHTESVGAWVLLVPVLLLPVGLIVMSYGLHRGRVAESWVVAAVAVGSVLFAVALPTGSPIAFVVGNALILIGLARIGWGVLTGSDEAWQNPPHVGAEPGA